MNEKSEYENKKNKKISLSFVVTILLILFLVTGVAGFTYAKYHDSLSYSDSSNAAHWGTLKLWEHEVKFNKESGIYEKTEKIVQITNGYTYNYDNIAPNMSIPKDTYIVIDKNIEVSYVIYLKVVETNVSSSIVSYSLRDEWGSRTLIDSNATSKTYLYKYNGVVEVGKEIFILKDDKLVIESGFEAGKHNFSLTFSAWMEQSK